MAKINLVDFLEMVDPYPDRGKLTADYEREKQLTLHIVMPVPRDTLFDISHQANENCSCVSIRCHQCKEGYTHRCPECPKHTKK